MRKPFIDLLTIQHWRQGYTLQVGIMRPDNAPKYRYTNADMDRQKYKSEVNYQLVGKYFKDLNEIQEYVKELNNN